jgi:HEAT repeat protein
MLLVELASDDSYKRRISASTLGYLHEMPVEVLLDMLNDTDYGIRTIAVRFLGKIRDNRAVLPLIKLLKDKDKSLRAVIISALGAIGDKRAVPDLIRCLKARNFTVRRNAFAAIVDIGDVRAVPTLIGCLEHRNWDVRHSAVKALGELRDARAVIPLEKRLYNDYIRNVIQAAAEALRKIGTPEALAAVEKWGQENQRDQP